tara:strand:+ start:82 stop:510 length:429 start_codon:yes stop_codon:yes gene_type:complete
MAKKPIKKAISKNAVLKKSTASKKRKFPPKKISNDGVKKGIKKTPSSPDKAIRSARLKKKVPNKKHYWLDDARNVNKIFYVLVFICIALVVSDAFYHKHTHYEFEGIFGFFGIFGFGLSFLLVLASRELRKFLIRDEDYYDR